MAKKTVDGLIAHCEKALKEKWKYVYGMKGKKMTKAQYNTLKKTYGNVVWNSDVNKVGHICCDCSGLISSYTGVLRGSAQYKATAVKVYPISKRTKDMKGYAVWMNGHIGIYDGNNGYYAMDGSARNMVHYPLSKNNFTHIIKLCDIDYGTGTKKVKAEKPVASGGAYNASNSSISATYAVKLANGKTLPFVTNLKDYAGLQGNKIVGLAVRFSKGKCWYRVHCNGKWLPKVTGCNWADAKNGWAGDGEHAIDGVQIEIEGGKTAYYRVSPLKKGYFAYQTDVVKNKSKKLDGYAGNLKNPIDRIQIYAK